MEQNNANNPTGAPRPPMMMPPPDMMRAPPTAQPPFMMPPPNGPQPMGSRAPFVMSVHFCVECC